MKILAMTKFTTAACRTERPKRAGFAVPDVAKGKRLNHPLPAACSQSSNGPIDNEARHNHHSRGGLQFDRSDEVIPLARRPVLFALARILSEAWPQEALRGTLLTGAFGAKQADESHRARLRVEIGRLRAALRAVANVAATPGGFALTPIGARQIVLLTPIAEDEHASVLAFLADGESWSSSALALALNAIQRTVQRALDSLAETGKVQSFGQGRARRWMTPPVPEFTTTLLLPVPLPDG